MSASASRLGHTLCAIVILAPAPAHAEVVDILWGPNGGFEREMSVAPGKFAEVCGKLSRGNSVGWSFESSAPLNFNIHYHLGKEVVVPDKADAIATLSGTLKVAADQDYCWMGSNKASEPARLRLVLKR